MLKPACLQRMVKPYGCFNEPLMGAWFLRVLLMVTDLWLWEKESEPERIECERVFITTKGMCQSSDAFHWSLKTTFSLCFFPSFLVTNIFVEQEIFNLYSFFYLIWNKVKPKGPLFKIQVWSFVSCLSFIQEAQKLIWKFLSERKQRSCGLQTSGFSLVTTHTHTHTHTHG